MARIVYNIACKDGIKQISGYTFSTGDLKFGVSNQSIATGENIVDWWVVTELTTGYSCANGNTKKEAIGNILKKDKLDIVTRYNKEHPHEDVNADVFIQSTYWGAW